MQGKKLTLEQFIERSTTKHNNKYDYSLVEYKDARTKVKIICPIHGVFLQTPAGHRIYGCHNCGSEASKRNQRSDKNIVIEKAKKVHGDKYDYSKVNYINTQTKIIVICKIHGEFIVSPNNHISKKSGCPNCSFERSSKRLTKDTNTFIKDSIKIHGNKYDYSLIDYKGCFDKVKIICYTHGLFLQTPDRHLANCGCPICNESKGENKIRKFLIKNHIIFEQEKRFDDCKYKNTLPFDFYLSKYNTCIEYDGEQHFRIIDYFGGLKSFKQIQMRDNIKNDYCKNNNISLIRISYKEFNSINNIIGDMKKCMNASTLQMPKIRN